MAVEPITQIRNDFASGELLPNAEFNALVNWVGTILSQIGEAFGSVILASTDFNLSIIASQLKVSVSAGTAIVGDTDNRRPVWQVGAATAPTTGNLTASQTNYVYLHTDGTYTANTTGTPPANSILVGTAVTDADDATSVDSNPAGRRNLGEVVGTTRVQTLTNKTLASPTVTGTASGPAADLDFAGGYRQTIDGWYQDNVTASQTAVVLSRLSVGAGFPTKWIAVRAGSVTGLVVKSTEARTAGTLTIEVFKNGSGIGLTAVLDGTNTTAKATTQAKDSDAFVAGDELDLRITTDAGWLPVTADIRASIEVET